jgi:hypothetical protein
VLFAVAALHAFGGITASADLARYLEMGHTATAFSEADGARYRGTGESAEDLQPLTRAELEQEYRVEECDGLLWVYDRQTGVLVFLFEKGPGCEAGGLAADNPCSRPLGMVSSPARIAAGAPWASVWEGLVQLAVHQGGTPCQTILRRARRFRPDEHFFRPREERRPPW